MIQPNCLESDSVASGLRSKVASANKAAPRYDLPGYAELLSDLKDRIARARIAARTAVNREIIFLYWQIGQEILARQKELGWGAKVIDRLSADLRHAFPEGSGFSSRNLKYMRRLAAAYEEEELVQQVVAQIPWGHPTVLLDRVSSPAEREWYAGQIIEHGWSRAVLRHHIGTNLFSRQGQAVTNFEHTLVPPQSDLAAEMLKDPYHLEFLEIGASARERDLERALLRHLRDFLLELGVGFALVGSQLLPMRPGQAPPSRRRRAEHRTHPLQGAKQSCGRVCAARVQSAHWCGSVPSHVHTSARTPREPS